MKSTFNSVKKLITNTTNNNMSQALTITYLQNIKSDDVIRYLEISGKGLKAVFILSFINLIGNAFIIVKYNAILGMSSAILAILMGVLSIIGLYILDLGIELIHGFRRLTYYERSNENNDLQIFKDQDNA